MNFSATPEPYRSGPPSQPLRMPAKRNQRAAGREEAFLCLISWRQDLAQLAMPPRWTQWAEDVLLPLMYWQEQLRRSRCPGQKAQIALVLQAVEEAFER